MAVYRVTRLINMNTWWIDEIAENMVTFNYNTIYEANIEVEKYQPAVPGETVWVEQSTPLAAFSQALMLFNEEIR